MPWGIQNQQHLFVRALLGQQVPQHDVGAAVFFCFLNTLYIYSYWPEKK
jgi:hypothetical protein